MAERCDQTFTDPGFEVTEEQEVVYGTSYHPYGKKKKLSQYWKDKFEHDAQANWNRFYKSNEDKFFKDRHYLEREFSELENTTSKVLEIGCGVGNSTLPLLDINPNLSFYSFDFSYKAIQILIERSRELQVENKICVFHWDPVTMEYPVEYPHKGHKSVIPVLEECDLGLVIFVLSAISPENMVTMMVRSARYIKSGGVILVRDYAVGDMAQKRFQDKTTKTTEIEENFYVRGDGTRAYYFSKEFMEKLSASCGIFASVEVSFIEKDVHNRELNLVMPRRFIQAKFNKK